MRTRTGMTLLVAIWLIAAAPLALAAKGGAPGKPGGDAEHPPGLTCRERLGDAAFTEIDGFHLTIGADVASPVCIDWTTTEETEWTLTVTGSGLRGAYVNLRDSHPGDFCWRGTLERSDLRTGFGSLGVDHSSGPLALTDEWRPIPIATIDACGTEYTDSAEALVLTIAYRGSGPFDIQVTPRP